MATGAARPGAEPDREALLRACGARAVALDDPEYPRRLRSLAAPPSVVYLAGDWKGAAPAVALVGARGASGDGADLARGLAADLAAAGVAVLSGLARGIDTAAHEGALDAGGRSGAVLGTGPDRAHPRENAGLQRRLRDSIGLLTEIPPGESPRPSTFASRNRLLAALADAVVVVQGRAGSGALITARWARSLGRAVGAVPWDCRDPLGAAPHALIRDAGATLVRHAGDVLELLPGAAAAGAGIARHVPGGNARLNLEPPPGAEPLSGAEELLARALRRHPEPLDVTAARAGLPAAAAAAAFVSLELRGLAESEPGGRVRRARRA